MHDESTRNRFWAKVEKTDDCWLWRAGRNSSGYGAFSLTHHKQVRAHRFSYEEIYGPIPDGLIVCHRCDNPICVNPAHLFLGEPRDNSADMVRKGRQATGDHVLPERRARGERNGMYTKPETRSVGERHWKARLTWNDVDDIRTSYLAGASIDDLAARYPQVRRSMITRILRGQAWVRPGEQSVNISRGRVRNGEGRYSAG